MPQTITATRADISILHIAARPVSQGGMGDVWQWYRIADANSLQDPMIYGTVKLIIPDPDPTTSTGVPPTS